MSRSQRSGPPEQERLTEWTSVEQLCDRYFNARPTAEVLELLRSVESGPPGVRAFAERALWLMKISCLGLENVSTAMAFWIGSVIRHILPDGPEGKIRPITSAGRHLRIDDYLAGNTWAELGAGSVFLDLGCGYPPLTTIDTAARFPAWRVVGAEPRFDDYIRDAAKTSVTPVTEDDEAARSRNTLRSLELANLSFIQAAIGEPLPEADVVRCMNVLMYYSPGFRSDVESWLMGILRTGGLFLCGTNGSRSFESRYSVYRKEDGRLVAREFAFSLDNLRPFAGGPWLALHDGERETWMLARLVGMLRSDERFRQDYDRRLDELLASNNILYRGPDGALRIPPDPVPPQEWVTAYERVSHCMEAEDFVNRAVLVLESAGLRAWLNVAGHVAIDPPPAWSF
jgi:SAM-dependent methyltransferase